MTRKPIEDLLAAELGRVMRQEVGAVFADFFKNVFDPRMSEPAVGRDAAAMGLNVIINNNAGVAVNATETQGAFNQKQLEITIDQMVANSLAQGRQTTGILRTLFGLAPTLSGR